MADQIEQASGRGSDVDTGTDPRSGNGGDAFARRHFLRNATMLSVENAGFLVAIAFVSSTTILPSFVTQLGGSPLLVGLIATCQTAGWLLPQLIGAGLCARKPRMMPYILGPLYVGRPAFLVLAVATLVLGTRHSWLLLTILYLAVLVFYATDGLASVPWYELIGKAIPPDRRGRMLGSAQILGGLAGMAVGGAISWVLASPTLPFPTSYALLFAISSAVFLLNLVPFLLVKEPVHEHASGRAAKPDAREFPGLLWPILQRDPNFVRLVVARLLFGVVTVTFPFYVVYVDRVFAMGPERVGLFVSAQVFGGLVGGLAIGWVADRLGTKTVMSLSGLVGATVPALGLAMLALRGLPDELPLYAGVLLFALVGIVGSANMIGFINYLLEVAPLELRSTYVGLFNTLAGVLLAVPPLAGWFLEATSFPALFAATVASSALCILTTIGLRTPVRSIHRR